MRGRPGTVFSLAILLVIAATPAWAAEGGEFPRVVNFAILAAILYFALKKPLGGYLQARTEQIREQLRQAREQQERAESERSKADELLAHLDDEVVKAKQEARRAAEAERERILSSAHEEAARIKKLARKEIDAEVEAGRRRLLARATELSVSLAHQKLQSSMTEDDQAKLIDRSIQVLRKAE